MIIKKGFYVNLFYSRHYEKSKKEEALKKIQEEGENILLF